MRLVGSLVKGAATFLKFIKDLKRATLLSQVKGGFHYSESSHWGFSRCTLQLLEILFNHQLLDFSNPVFPKPVAEHSRALEVSCILVWDHQSQICVNVYFKRDKSISLSFNMILHFFFFALNIQIHSICIQKYTFKGERTTPIQSVINFGYPYYNNKSKIHSRNPLFRWLSTGNRKSVKDGSNMLYMLQSVIDADFIKCLTNVPETLPKLSNLFWRFPHM